MGALTHNGEVLQSLPANASQVNFDKTGTNLNSTQTEAAIKEVNTKVNTNTTDINQLRSGLTNVITIPEVSGIFEVSFKYNRIALLRIYTTIQASNSGWLKIGTVDDRLKPPTEMRFVAYDNDASTNSGMMGGIVRVKANGDVEIYSYSDKLNWSIAQDFMYITN